MAAALLATACSGDDDGGAATTTTAVPPLSEPAASTSPVTPTTAATTTSQPATPATFEAHGSVEQVWLVGAAPGAKLELLDDDGTVMGSGEVDDQGSFLFRQLPAGDGYRIRQDDGGEVTESDALTVLSGQSAPPDSSLYDQSVAIDPATNSGYGYITTRDGTTLAANVILPGPADEGPYPTVVEYSGYDPANPAGGDVSLGALLPVLGYAYVGVNMRGTGCSGGAFDYFEPLQSLDGYDAVEAIARQPWVLHQKVGMVGVSWPGISQLFVASTRPPSLAAITPLSVIDDPAAVSLPGGILNNGFALEWSQSRMDQAKPAGQQWAADLIDQGDETCAGNQALRLQNVDLVAKARENVTYDPVVANPLTPLVFVDQIQVPVYLACQFQDEQTGGHCPAMIVEFRGTAKKWFTLTNGVHIDSIDPATFVQWYDFLEIYVAQRAPKLSDGMRAVAPVLYSSAMGVDGVQLPPDPIQDQPDYESAKAAFEALAPVRVLFENGAGNPAAPGSPVPTFEQRFDTWPVPGVAATPWYLGPEGSLTAGTAGGAGADAFVWDPAARPRTNFTGSGGDIWRATPTYEWAPPVAGKALSYVSPPLDADQVMIGSGAVNLWVQSTAADTDLQVTLTEVRPDGNEVFVQGGWLRASYRVLDDEASTALAPVLSAAEEDLAPLPAGEWTEVSVPLYHFAHVFRIGSRIRITVQAPGGDQPFWAFETLPADGEVVNTVTYGTANPSHVLLPLVDSVTAPSPLPPCGALRGQPCRPYQAFTNTPGAFG